MGKMPKMSWSVFVLGVLCLCRVSCQLEGSGTNGNLRLCVVEARGGYRLAPKFCPVLEREGAGVECVVGSDRLDCLRRMNKGTVDFGVFDPEDLVATQWASVDLLVTNQLKATSHMFAAEVACVVSRGWLLQAGMEGGAGVILRNSTLCHPGHGGDGLSDTLADYLESLVTERSCDPALTLAENRLLSVANYFRAACKPGPWVGDEVRDMQLKRLHPSLCAACGGGSCSKDSGYWGRQGSLNCLTDGAGDVTWATVEDVRHRFGLNGERQVLDDPRGYAYLCHDGTVQSIVDNSQPCVWVNKPWPVIVAKRKSAEAVSRLQEQLTDSATLVGGGWRAALLSLLESRTALPPPLRPQQAPQDYLATARGFREAYSRAGCNPSRHITVCTAGAAEQAKCEWMAEAGAVYGAEPPLQCAARASRRACVLAVAGGAADALTAEADWLVSAQREHNLSAILFESSPIVGAMHVVVGYTRADAAIDDIGQLRGRRAAFPVRGGVAWHSVAHYLVASGRVRGCSSESVARYFGESCAGEQEEGAVQPGEVEAGEEAALRLLAEGRVDVAFVGMDALTKYTGINATEPWAARLSGNDTRIICPDGDATYCFFSWSSPGQLYVSAALPPMRRQEILNAFQQLDRLFGKSYPFHKAAFTMFGPFGHEGDLLFHDSMRSLVTIDKFKGMPFVNWPRNYEMTIVPDALNEKCGSSGEKKGVSIAMFSVCLVLCLLSCMLRF